MKNEDSVGLIREVERLIRREKRYRIKSSWGDLDEVRFQAVLKQRSSDPNDESLKRLAESLAIRKEAALLIEMFRTKPPRHLMYLAAFAQRPSDREAALGDIEERFRADLKRFGGRRATFLLILDTVLSLVGRVGTPLRNAMRRILYELGWEYVRRTLN